MIAVTEVGLYLHAQHSSVEGQQLDFRAVLFIPHRAPLDFLRTSSVQLAFVTDNL